MRFTESFTPILRSCNSGTSHFQAESSTTRQPGQSSWISLHQQAGQVLGDVTDPLLTPVDLHGVGVPRIGRFVVQRERIADGDSQGHLFGRIGEPVGQEGLEDLALAIAAAPLLGCSAFAAAGVVRILKASH